jgi:release factor glutamine methyltransferase
VIQPVSRSVVLPDPVDHEAVATERLHRAGVMDPQGDAAALAAHVFSADSATEPATIAAYFDLVERRCQRVPLEHLIGRVRFRDLELLVGPGVFVP